MQAHYSPRAQKFHLHRGFHWTTLNSFRGEKKVKMNHFSKIPVPPTGQGLAQGLPTTSPSPSPCVGTQPWAGCRGSHKAPAGIRRGHTRTAAAQGSSKHVLQKPEHLRSRALCHRLGLVVKGKGRKGRVGSRWTQTSSRLSKVFTALGYEFGE